MLPNELVDCILDNLSFDTATLLNCALVERAWVASSQRGIFRHIILEWPIAFPAHIDGIMKATRALATSLSENPHLASYVHSLELHTFLQLSKPEDLEELHAVTASVVQLLSNVGEIIFTRVDWSILSPPLKLVLTDMLIAPSLTQLSLSHFYISTFAELASLLSRMKHLKALHAADLVCQNWDMTSSSVPEDCTTPKSIQLEQLELDENGVFALGIWLQHDSCPIEIRNLHSLHIEGSPSPERVSFVQYVGRNLRELELLSFGWEDKCYLEFTPNLRKLHLGGLYQGDEPTPTAIIQALFEPLLNPNGNTFPLQHLTISLAFVEDDDPLQTHHWDEWPVIDALLEKPEFASFGTVNFQVRRINACDSVIPSGVRELLIGKLPFLKGSGKLVVELNKW